MAGPLGIGTCTAWWDASAAGGLTLGAGTDVATFVDQSGSGRNISQSTVGERPAKVSGLFGTLPGVQFDGTNDWMGTSGPTLGDLVDATDFCIAIAMRGRAAATDNANADSNDGVFGEVGAYSSLGLRSSTGFYGMVYDSARRQVAVSPSPAFGTTGLHIVLMWLDANVLHLQVNGVEATVAVPGSVGDLSGAMRLGRISTNTNYAEIDLGEMVWFDSQLTTQNRTDLKVYLQEKWGVIHTDREGLTDSVSALVTSSRVLTNPLGLTDNLGSLSPPPATDLPVLVPGFIPIRGY